MAFLAIAFCWAHLMGERLHEQKPIPIKSHKRPAKSIFRHGLDFLRGILLNLNERIKELNDAVELLKGARRPAKCHDFYCENFVLYLENGYGTKLVHCLGKT